MFIKSQKLETGLVSFDMIGNLTFDVLLIFS